MDESYSSHERRWIPILLLQLCQDTHTHTHTPFIVEYAGLYRLDLNSRSLKDKLAGSEQ